MSIAKHGSNLVVDHWPLWEDVFDRAKLRTISKKVDAVNTAFELPKADGNLPLHADSSENALHTKTTEKKNGRVEKNAHPSPTSVLTPTPQPPSSLPIVIPGPSQDTEDIPGFEKLTRENQEKVLAYQKMLEAEFNRVQDRRAAAKKASDEILAKACPAQIPALKQLYDERDKNWLRDEQVRKNAHKMQVTAYLKQLLDDQARKTYLMLRASG